MSRAYTQADKMILIAKHYYVLNISQTLSMIGAFLFIFVIVIPTWSCMSSLSPASVSLSVLPLSLSLANYLYLYSLVLTVYKDKDALIMTIITVALSFIAAFMFVSSNISASALQLLKTKQFLQLLDSTTGRLLPRFYPSPAADVTPEYFSSMFVKDDRKAAGSLLEYART
jgi:hypothetical protein